jgi:pyruvate dehydrogenase E1 component alpha subunit
VDGFDVLAVYEAMLTAVSRARAGEGPTLLMTECYRLEGHYAGEPEVYGSRDEVREQWKNDPIPRFSRYLSENSLVSAQELDAISAAVRQEMLDAIDFAKASPLPDPATWSDYIYA